MIKIRKIKRLLIALVVPCALYTAVLTASGRTYHNLDSSGREIEIRWEPDLSIADEQLLDRNLYDQWVFTERLIELEEYRGAEDWETNFSAQGVEEMKKVVISFKETEVYGYHDEQSAFQNAADMYLYMIYGGANPVDFPVYHVERDIDPNAVYLRDLVNSEGKYIQFPEKENMVMVYYNLGYDEDAMNPAIRSSYLGAVVYIDPFDTESLYMDFCGLWKLERYQNGYLDRDGKWEDAGF